jgi:PKD repeat protein
MDFLKIILMTLITLVIVFQQNAIGRDIDALQRVAVILEKPQIVISERAKDYLQDLEQEKVKIWVFFNDKAIFNDNDFKLAALSININEHTAKRRAKVGINNILFADLPVSREYIDRIIDHGGRLRRVSKWLNAASFEIDISLLDNISDLPFVNEIKPVAFFYREKGIDSRLEPKSPRFTPAEKDILDYGSSWTQIFMINAYLLHMMGYNGQGVIVAMLDTGYRKSHQAFALADSTGRILDEYDFIFDDNETQNEPEDDAYQHYHGTYCWSTLGGYTPGDVIGPAFGASFLLAKTEDVRDETPVEEDNWVAAMEWADSLGADVISTSLGYSLWYTYEDMDGNTATTTVAANTAASLGIIVCNSMGNSGPNPGTLSAPADAFDILACGAVNSGWTIADFSSRGSTYDGRTKPEVCAMGVDTYCANASGDYDYTYKNGTSLSTPLVGGAAAVLLSANPSLTPWQVRQALMETANNATSPNNTYGWGIIDMLKAFNWGANFTADTTIGYESQTVNFTDSSSVTPTSWKWYFGDDDSSIVQNPTHIYSTPGSFDVTLIIEYSEGTLTRAKEDFIHIVADTLIFESASASPGDTAIMSIHLLNSQEIHNITIPVYYGMAPDMNLVQATLGTRTKDFESIEELFRYDSFGQLVFEMTADAGGGALPLEPGTGEIARLFFVIDSLATIGDSIPVTATIIDGHEIELGGKDFSYAPDVTPGNIIIETNLRGDADNSGDHNIFDVTYLISYLYMDGPPPISLRAGDANADDNINIFDVTYLIAYLYMSGPPPPE